MADDLVLTDRRDDGVVLVTLNNGSMNPLSQAVLARIADVADALAGDASVKAVVITGSEKALAAGADIKEFGDQEAARRIAGAFRRAFDAVAAIPRPVIAAVRGYALGGGMELALSCDLRVAGENMKARWVGARHGVPVGPARLAPLLGEAIAKDLIFTSRALGA